MNYKYKIHIMHALILKRTYSTLLISTMLTSSLITQSFAMQPTHHDQKSHTATQTVLSASVKNLQTKLTRRTSAYNEEPTHLSIPRDTSEINSIYERAPEARYANDDEREAVIKGLMLTAGIHGRSMPLDAANQTLAGSTLNALQKHYAIIHAIDVLSRDYFINNIFFSKRRAIYHIARLCWPCKRHN